MQKQSKLDLHNLSDQASTFLLTPSPPASPLFPNFSSTSLKKKKFQNHSTNGTATNLLFGPPIVTHSMGYMVPHRFIKRFKVMTCDYCNKQMFFGLKCKECKYRCHKDCESYVPVSCDPTQEFEFKGTFRASTVSLNFQRPNSTNKESNSSSTPSSPKLIKIKETPAKQTKFYFPDVSSRLSILSDSQQSNGTVSCSSASDSLHCSRHNSISLKEWDIPFDELELREPIGSGRFGTVHHGLWHGNVAVKILKENYLTDEKTLEAFKSEVANFKKTRHDNVILFMGACMKAPHLAIVTSLCKGNTLFTHIHTRRDTFNLTRISMIATQICQGMSYLHAREIVHKDLKTKNIFLENGKVIITDFGLFSAKKLNYSENGLGVPQGWLCYLAPELINKLTPFRPINEDFKFTKKSDIYSFGGIWYELLCGKFPFNDQCSEATIWQIGRGLKQTMANLQASSDVKDIAMICWSFQKDDRPEFSKLLIVLEKLPKKRLARSPASHSNLSRSAESLF